jgi:ABC-type transporter MlaC component
MTRALTLVVSLVFLAQPALAQNGKETVDHLFRTFAMSSAEMPDTQKFAVANQEVDYDYIAKGALNASDWSKLTPAQKQDFKSNMKVIMEQHYYPRWYKLFSKGKLTYLGEEDSSGDKLVKTVLKVGKKTDTLTWRLHPADGQLKLASLSFGDDDLLAHLHKRMETQVERKGLKGLIASLRKKAEKYQ